MQGGFHGRSGMVSGNSFCMAHRVRLRLSSSQSIGFCCKSCRESFFQESRNVTPTATPYRSGVPIDSIAPSTDDDDFPDQLRRTAAYQSLIGSIGLALHFHPS